ncbi:ZIP family metal transporter [Rhodospirillaceae bacterium SYSU D60014]|uniref:ZIP family metal transporter n=1 Tax=Virgifigura deserti TaxID=2268457 RepID=UPI000E6692C6
MPFPYDVITALSPVQQALLGSLIAGLATAVGALPVLAWPRPSARSEGALLGFAAGVMLAAASFSLVLPGLDAASALVGAGGNAALMIGAGILLGAGGLFAAHNTIPHEHFILGPDGAATAVVSHHWLLVFAVAIHNLPEGLAVGAGFGGGDLDTGLALMLGIGLQNMPEGLVVAAALLADGYSRGRAFTFALMTGLIEPVGGMIAAAAMGAAQMMLPWGYAAAAGAMLFVVSHEIIPETHRKGVQGHATIGLLVGFVTMMYLSVAVG